MLINNFGGGGGIDTSDATATASDLVTGVTAYGADGTKITGSLGTFIREYTSDGVLEKDSNPTALSAARAYLAATTVGNYGLFGGGSSGSVVDAYNTSLTRSTPTALSAGRNYLAATTVGNYGLFGGGGWYTNSYSSVVDAYQVIESGTYRVYQVS